MYSPEGNFTGNNTTSEIILFEVPSNRRSSTGRVGVVGRECPRAKAESKKQCVDLKSTSIWMGIDWRWSGAHTRGETKRIGIRKSGHVEMHWTCSCINKFNVTPSLC